MKRSLLTLVLAATLATPAYALIPVTDGIQIAGQLQQLSQGLVDYEQYIQQTALSNSQLLEAYKRYDQMLADYQQVLREAEQLKTQLEGVDLQNFLNRLKNIDLYDPSYASGDDPNVGSKPWDDAVERNKLLNGWGMTDEEWSEMNASIPYSGNDRERAKEIFQYRKRKAEMAIRQDVASENFADNISEQAEQAQKTKEALDGLGDNDSLATMQLIARQNQLMIEQNLNNQAQGNADFKMSNQLANDYFNKMAKARERKEKAMSESYKNGGSQ
ncbi:hypothetical protein [Scandinavium goeteborgense]|uniref:Type IV secretion system protein VirB5 n=1 Tax=Scandinavium goeteborgense TaxID=1851514 RepID=A0A4R6DSS6_SCAGO|nr:hypothetical protein [Scandinavium goeteborgense]TDN48073.1 hypothetical protein EC847_12824 [Scandinavium goeteborgense]